MTLTCVQRKTEMLACVCVSVRDCVCALVCVCVCVCVHARSAKERGVQYERVARANRATDSAPAWRQWKTKHGSTCVEKEQSICPWRQPLPPSPPPSLSLFSFSSSPSPYPPGSLLTETRPEPGWWDECWAKSNTGPCIHTRLRTHGNKKKVIERFSLGAYVVKVYYLRSHLPTWFSAALMWFKSGCGAMWVIYFDIMKENNRSRFIHFSPTHCCNKPPWWKSYIIEIKSEVNKTCHSFSNI